MVKQTKLTSWGCSTSGKNWASEVRFASPGDKKNISSSNVPSSSRKRKASDTYIFQTPQAKRLKKKVEAQTPAKGKRVLEKTGSDGGPIKSEKVVKKEPFSEPKKPQQARPTRMIRPANLGPYLNQMRKKGDVGGDKSCTAEAKWKNAHASLSRRYDNIRQSNLAKDKENKGLRKENMDLNKENMALKQEIGELKKHVEKKEKKIRILRERFENAPRPLNSWRTEKGSDYC